MQVKINNKSYSINSNQSIVESLTELGLFSETGIAIAVNQKVISKDVWKETLIKDGDEILVIKATQGG